MISSDVSLGETTKNKQSPLSKTTVTMYVHNCPCYTYSPVVDPKTAHIPHD